MYNRTGVCQAYQCSSSLSKFGCSGLKTNTTPLTSRAIAGQQASYFKSPLQSHISTSTFIPLRPPPPLIGNSNSTIRTPLVGWQLPPNVSVASDKKLQIVVFPLYKQNIFKNETTGIGIHVDDFYACDCNRNFTGHAEGKKRESYALKFNQKYNNIIIRRV